MKIVCSVATCKYSSENEDSAGITFISFPNNDTAAIWAQNCGRVDLTAKATKDLHTDHYICSDHIEDRFFISKQNPMTIAQGAVPTIFPATRHSNDRESHSARDNCQAKSLLDSLQLSEFINIADVCRSHSLADDDCAAVYQLADATNDANFVNGANQSQGTIVAGLINLCRMCSQPADSGTEIFTDEGLKMELREKILLHTPIKVDLGDSLPLKICSGCCNKLEATHSLVATCLRTDMRLRRFFNISGKAVYDRKFEKLVAACSMEMASEINFNDVGTNDESAKTSSRKFDSKWRQITSEVSLEQVEICPTSSAQPSNDVNASSLKYVVHPDLKNLLHALTEIGPKSDERNNESSEGNLRLICLNGNAPFETEVQTSFGSHETICDTQEAQTEQTSHAENDDCRVVCPVCRVSFLDEDFFEKHKKTCHYTWPCRNCDELFANKEDLDAHESSTHTKKANVIVTNSRKCCGHCSAVFDTRKELQTHIAKSHEDRQLFKCGLCEKTYGKWSSLDVHEATHRLDKPYLCDLCGKSFKHSNNLRGHKRTHLDDSKKKRHVCDICGSAFRSRFHLQEHTNQHNDNKPYTCEECGKAFYKRIQLRQHRLSHGSNKHACPICGMSFNRRGNMKTHLKRHSKSEGMYTCSVCEYKCKSMSELKQHRKQHTEEDIIESIKQKTADKSIWQCKTCDKLFPKRAILVKHERVHSGDRATVECDKCGKKLANKSSLRYHQKSMHSTERPHVCRHCPEGFVSKEALLVHERIHTGERPYACKICDMQYRCSSNLSQHMKIHSSIRPHVCRYCGKAFARKGALNVHERIHTGLKPFVCHICSRSFSQKNDMLKHTKIHQSKSTLSEKSDELLTVPESEALGKHELLFQEQSAVEQSLAPQYVEATKPSPSPSTPLVSYALAIHSPTIEETQQLSIVLTQ